MFCVFMMLSLAVIGNLAGQEIAAPTNQANIELQFNGGSKLCIGQKNTLEIMVKNSSKVSAISLGFEFSCPAKFNLVADYGMITPDSCPAKKALEIHNNAFGECFNWQTFATTFEYPKKIHIGGVILPETPFCYLPAHKDKAVTLYSLQIELPNDKELIGKKFSVKAVAFSAPMNWSFTDSSGNAYAPYFQGQPIGNVEKPNVIPVSFDIVGAGDCKPAPDMAKPKSGEADTKKSD